MIHMAELQYISQLQEQGLTEQQGLYSTTQSRGVGGCIPCHAYVTWGLLDMFDSLEYCGTTVALHL